MIETLNTATIITEKGVIEKPNAEKIAKYFGTGIGYPFRHLSQNGAPASWKCGRTQGCNPGLWASRAGGWV